MFWDSCCDDVEDYWVCDDILAAAEDLLDAADSLSTVVLDAARTVNPGKVVLDAPSTVTPSTVVLDAASTAFLSLLKQGKRKRRRILDAATEVQ